MTGAQLDAAIARVDAAEWWVDQHNRGAVVVGGPTKVEAVAELEKANAALDQAMGEYYGENQ